MKVLRANSLPSLLWKTLLLLVFVRPFLCERAFPTLNVYYQSSLLVIVLGWLTSAPRISLLKLPFRYGIGLFLLGIAISTMSSIDRGQSAKEIYKFVPYVAIFYAMSQTTKENIRTVLLTLVAAATIISFYSIYQYFLGFKHVLDYISKAGPYSYGQEFLGRKRVFATFFSPNMLAGYLVMMIPLTLGLCFDKKRKLLVTGYWLLVTLLISTLALTKSLGGILTLGVCMGMFFVLLKPQRQSKKLYFFLIGGALLLICIVLADRYQQIFDLSHPYNPIVRRLGYWKGAVDTIRSNFLTGVGLGNFGLAYLSNKPSYAEPTLFAHNSYLQIWAEMGIMGVIGWLWIVFEFLREGAKRLSSSLSKSLRVGLLASGTAFFIHNLIDFDFFVPEVAFHWWLMLGLIVAIGQSD